MSNFFGGLWQTAGWTMLHFLWLGTLIGLAAVVLRLMLRRTTPNVRYAAALGVLALLTALPIGILSWLVKNPSLPLAVMHVSTSIDPSSASIDQSFASIDAGSNIIELSGRESPLETSLAESPADRRQISTPRLPDTFTKALATLESCVSYLPWLWLVGTPITFFLLTAGLIGSDRLRRTSRVIDDGPIAELVTHLRKTMRIGRRVTVAVCERIAAPILVGILRPMILLPPAALSGWSPDEIEMVFLHELAHVRRWDNLVNLAQRCTEALLFFHPAVWLVSNWVRREREACCDAVVVGRTNRPHAYAELLVALAAQMPRSVLFHPVASSAMAAGPLRSRIRSILKLEDDPMLVSGKSFVFVLGSLVVAATLAVLYLPQLGQAEEQEPVSKEKVVGLTSTDNTVSNSLETNREVATADDSNRTQVIKKLPADITIGELITIIDALIKSGEADGAEILIGLPPQKRAMQFEIAKAMRERHKAGKIADASTAWISGNQIELTIRSPKAPGGQAQESATLSTELNRELTQSALGNNLALTAEQKVESENWLAGIAFPSPNVAAISRRAWKELGLKVVPATDEELALVRPHGWRVGLKLLDFDGVPQAEGPFILTEIQLKGYATGITSFFDLDRALTAIASQPADDVIILNGAHKSGRFNYAMHRPQGVKGAIQRRFPSLEDQKLADIAWKRLGIELEAISSEDLKRVQALGFEGGLKVASVGNEPKQQGIQQADILVGLHAWQTVSLKQVLDVLNRDDLAELNPLKYYVVRPGRTEFADGGGGFPAVPLVDSVITGRITVQPSQSPRGFGTSTNQPPTGADSWPSNPWGATPQLPTTPASEKSVLVAPSQPHFIELPGPANDVSTRAPALKVSSPPPIASGPNLVPLTQAAPPVLVAQGSAKSIESNTPAANKANLRYEGKTFDEWRSAWQTELSTEKRLEAVKALAAFGANGYGRDAAEAILEIAMRYDWQFTRVQNANKLQSAVLEALYGGDSRQRIPPVEWFPMVLERVKSGDKNAQQFARWILWNFHALGPEGTFATDSLLDLTHSDSPDLRHDAVIALGAIDRQHTDARIVARLKELLEGSDTQDITAALESVNGANAPLPFDASKLLFHPDPEVRTSALNAIFKLTPPGTDLGKVLLGIIQDPTRSEDHVAAIRALARYGTNATFAVDPLEKKIMDQDQPMPTRVAAMNAFVRITGDAEAGSVLLNKVIEQNKERQDTPEFRRDFKQFSQAINGN